MSRSDLPTLGFIGTGVVAAALSGALADAGYRVAAVHGRTAGHAERLARTLHEARAARSRQDVVNASDIVFLAVPDDAIASVAESVVWSGEHAAVHCNGAASVDLLAAAARAGSAVGVLHPLQSFASVEQARCLIPGSAFRVEASGEALRQSLEAMARAIGGRPFFLGVDPTLYHVSAVLASNYLVTLSHLASELWTELGVTRQQGLEALLPLLAGTLENMRRLGTPAALTGPIARGDAGTVARHVAVLSNVAPHMLPVYKELGLQTISVALAKGTIDAKQARRIEAALAGTAKGEPGCV